MCYFTAASPPFSDLLRKREADKLSVLQGRMKQLLVRIIKIGM